MSEAPITESIPTEPIRLIRQRKAAMAAVGMTGKDVADQLGVTKATISSVVLGWNRSLRIRAGFARIVGRSIDELFPQSVDALRMSSATECDKVA